MSAETCDFEALAPGDLVHAFSRSGNEYELHVLTTQPFVYIRLADQGLARLYHERVNRLRRLERGRTILHAGDRIWARHCQGYQLEGRVMSSPADRLTLTRPSGEVMSVPISEVVATSLRLCFRAPNLKVGEEFRIRSRSGREYSGVLESTRDSVLSVRGVDGVSTLRAARLDFYTLVVLIPIDLVQEEGGACLVSGE